MLSADNDPWKYLDNPHHPPHVGRSTKTYDQEHWDLLREQTILLREHMLLAWETALVLIDRRCQIAQDHQDLRLQRQRLLEQQAAYLEDILPL